MANCNVAGSANTIEHHLRPCRANALFPKKELLGSFPFKNKDVGVSTHHQVGNDGSDFQYQRKISISHVPSNGTELTLDFELAR